ncbi:hypothetical protein GGI20_005233 [Coemansia sp. BCRC 34301]|nr:hypothetical protein GGI20_005233 [Coemansia sp. BCRC 34301]
MGGSTAQRLPIDVLRCVMLYITHGSSRRTLGKARQGKAESMDELKALLYVSSTWRAAALEYIWRELYLVISSKERRAYVDQPDLAYRFKLLANAAELIKLARVIVSWMDVANRTAQAVLEWGGRDVYRCGLVKDDAMCNALDSAEILRSMAVVSRGCR